MTVLYCVMTVLGGVSGIVLSVKGWRNETKVSEHYLS